MTTPDGPVALVTGSSRGIGAAVARRLHAEGMQVAVSSARSVEAGEKVAAEIGGIYVQSDISDDSQARGLVREVVERFGRLDVLVNSAGTTVSIPHRDLEAVTAQVWQEILTVNLLGPWQVIRAAVPHLKARAEGVVINVSSRAGSRPTGSSIPYAVSKAGLNHLTVLLANVLGPDIRVNAVAPGLVDTSWTSGAAFDPLRAEVESKAPLARVGQPEDVAEAVMGLIRSRYTTGEVLLVDGGMFMR